MLDFIKSGAMLLPFDAKAQKMLDSVEDGAIVQLRRTSSDVGSSNMLRTWRMWMAEIAVHGQHRGATMPLMVDRHGEPHGSRPYNSDDAHEMFCNLYLGCNKEGRRLSWSMDPDGEDVVATKSQRLFAMDKVVIWAAENTVPITIPRQGDYWDYMEAQER